MAKKKIAEFYIRNQNLFWKILFENDEEVPLPIPNRSLFIRELYQCIKRMYIWGGISSWGNVLITL